MRIVVEESDFKKLTEEALLTEGEGGDHFFFRCHGKLYAIYPFSDKDTTAAVLHIDIRNIDVFG